MQFELSCTCAATWRMQLDNLSVDVYGRNIGMNSCK